jgi:tRNA(Arg) A34 adenosine deaminase TadA
MQATIQFSLPAWIEEAVAAGPAVYASPAERMALTIRLARLNAERGTGGPFGAAVFERESGRLVAAGVNLVLPSGLSIAHAEIVALSFAQRARGHYDLAAPGQPACELVSSTEPCAMCLGAIPWSGVKALVCGARDEDARAIGFDEGDKPADWPRALAARGIAVTRDVARAEAAAVLRWYAERGGAIYNSGLAARQTTEEDR